MDTMDFRKDTIEEKGHATTIQRSKEIAIRV